MNSILLALMLLFPVAQPPAKPQAIHVGGNVTAAEVAQAKAILAASQPKELKLKVGEFEIIEPSKDAKPLQFQYLTNQCYKLYQVQPGETLVMIGVRRGDAMRQLHRFEAKPYRWAVIEAVLQGSEVVVINRNGLAPDKDPPEEVERVLVLVGEQKPTPKPDDPKPDDNKPIPIPGAGLRVLFVYESKDLSKLPSAQVQMLTAKSVLDYLDTHTVKENGIPEYRKFDQDTNVSGMSSVWQQAMDRVKNGVGPAKEGKAITMPWLLISNGKEGYEGEWPKNTDELLKLLKKFGGE